MCIYIYMFVYAYFLLFVYPHMYLCFRDASSKGNDDKSASKLLTAPVKISEDTRMLGQDLDS